MPSSSVPSLDQAHHRQRGQTLRPAGGREQGLDRVGDSVARSAYPYAAQTSVSPARSTRTTPENPDRRAASSTASCRLSIARTYHRGGTSWPTVDHVLRVCLRLDATSRARPSCCSPRAAQERRLHAAPADGIHACNWRHAGSAVTDTSSPARTGIGGARFTNQVVVCACVFAELGRSTSSRRKRSRRRGYPAGLAQDRPAQERIVRSRYRSAGAFGLAVDELSVGGANSDSSSTRSS